MSGLPKKIHDESNGLNYCLVGDYYLPDITANEEEISLGRYGLSRMIYLREYRPGLYNRLLLSGKLYDHLMETDSEANQMLDRLLPQMAKAAGIDEKLKASDQMKWVGMMNALKNQVEELIWEQVVYR